MGWDFTDGASKKDVIQDIITQCGTGRCIAHSLRGNCLWTVWEELEGDPDCRHREIVLYILGSHEGSWGSKSISAISHPYYYNCPLSYLTLVPPQLMGPDEKAWREGVQAYHAKQNRGLKLQVGSRVRLVPGCSVGGVEMSEVVITSLRPLLTAPPPGVNLSAVRLKRRMIAEVLP